MKRLYASLTSNAGLILLATLALGVWTSNVRSFYQRQSAPCPSPSPSIAQRKSAEEILNIQPQTAEDRLRLWWQELTELGRRVKAQYPGEYDDLTDGDVGRKVRAKYPNATAICNDNTASHSQTRSGTCSYHGGVKVWLRSLDTP